MSSESFLENPPAGDELTPYDLAHLRIYLQLLDIEAEAKSGWRKAAATVFGIDPDADTDRAHRLYDVHLLRAHWMTESGYRQLAALGEAALQFGEIKLPTANR